MAVVLQNTFTIVFIVEFMIGNFGNGFIVLVNCMDWVRRRKISPVEQILTALAISRIGLLWVVFLDWWMSVFYPALLMTEYMIRLIYLAWTLTSHFNNWLSTSLSIFYFLKITVLSNSFFLYLKWRCKQVISVVLLMSLVFLFLSMIFMWIQLDVLIFELKGNRSYNSNQKNYAHYSKFVLFPNLMLMLIPFCMSLIAFLLLIFSLWKHHKNMQHNDQGGRDARTTAHIRAAHTVTAFLLLYISFFLSLVAQVWTFNMEKKLIILFGKATLTIFPSGHSCILILGNNKLRHALLLVLQGLRCRFKNADPPGS